MEQKLRLLTDEEIADIIIETDDVLSDTKANRKMWINAVKENPEPIKSLISAQDLKTAQLVREETLKEVGDKLKEMHDTALPEYKWALWATMLTVNNLKSGKMPEGK